MVSNSGAAISKAEAAQQADQAWRAVRGDETIQFAPVTVPPEPLRQDPQWLKDLLRNLGEGLAEAWPVLKWLLLAFFAAFLAYMVWQLIAPLLGRPWRRADQAAPEWRPDRIEAEALLEEADALAAAGRFDEATHLLLRRSVSQIATARAEWVRPASTARELAHLPALPDAARTAFAALAGLVERSRYALRALDAADWHAAREAYAAFALERIAA